MSISVTKRSDGKLVISCGDEAIVYPSEGPRTPPPAVSSSETWSEVFNFSLTPSSPRVQVGLARRLDFRPARVVSTIGAFEREIATAAAGPPAQGSLTFGWNATEPLQIAEVRQVVERYQSLPFDVDIYLTRG